MQLTKHDSHRRPVLTQAENNTTIWIGHLRSDTTDHFAGQTFKCPAEGFLDNIQIYASTVHYPGEITMTFYEFDAQAKNWGPSIASSTIFLQRDNASSWIKFDLEGISLFRDINYGFRLKSPEALIGLGEAASVNKEPFSFGHEWNGDSVNEKGNFFTYFSLAFKVELRA
jgi:hypothetical protein